ncbi:MAG: hypothetical protein AAF266_10585, partial [Planctomycetota bacterium]
ELSRFLPVTGASEDIINPSLEPADMVFINVAHDDYRGAITSVALASNTNRFCDRLSEASAVSRSRCGSIVVFLSGIEDYLSIRPVTYRNAVTRSGAVEPQSVHIVLT